MRLYPLAIIIALASVGLTRVTHLHPGVIFGFVTAAAIAPSHALSRRERGMIILIPVVGLLAVSVVAFFLIDPLRTFSQEHTGVWASLPQTVAIALFVGGAESVLLTLIPVTFNDGEAIWSWNKWVWFVLALPASFMFFHVVVNNEDYGTLARDTSKLALLIICGVIVFISAATWLYFRLRRGKAAD